MKFSRAFINRILISVTFSVGVLCTHTLFADSDSGVTSEQLSRLTRIITKLTIDNHIEEVVLDDATSSKILDAYLNELDPQHFIFLDEDVSSFKAEFEIKLDDALKNGDPSACFKIFDVFQKRLKEVEQFADEFLGQAISLTSGEKIVIDRKKSPWPKSVGERNDFIRLTTAHTLLSEVAGAKEAEDTLKQAQARLQKQIHRRYSRFYTMKKIEIFEGFINSFLHLYDPHTDYMSPVDSTEFQAQVGTASLYGIGAQIREDEDGGIIVAYIVKGGAAEASGKIEVGDQITDVKQDQGDFESIENLSIREALAKLRGRKDSKVSIRIERRKNGQILKDTIAMLRKPLPVESQRASAILLDYPLTESKSLKVGVLQVPSFYVGPDGDPSEGASMHSAKLIELMKAQGMEALILDLRWNSGGEIGEAVNLAGLFVDGPIVQAKMGRVNPQIKLFRDRIKNVYDGPLEVLVNHESASASEIVTGALQDYERAIVVGSQSTFGKGSIQTGKALKFRSFIGVFLGTPMEEDLGYFKITTGRFYRVNGQTTQKFGITPHIILPSQSELYIGESSLDASIKPDTLNAVEYSKDNRVTSFLEELRKRSSQRVAQTKEFSYIQESVTRVLEERKESETKAQSIDLVAFQAKLKLLKDREDTIKAERSSRPEKEHRTIRYSFDGKSRVSNSWYSELPEGSTRPLSNMAYEDRALLDEGLQILADLHELSLKK